MADDLFELKREGIWLINKLRESMQKMVIESDGIQAHINRYEVALCTFCCIFLFYFAMRICLHIFDWIL